MQTVTRTLKLPGNTHPDEVIAEVKRQLANQGNSSSNGLSSWARQQLAAAIARGILLARHHDPDRETDPFKRQGNGSIIEGKFED